MTIPSINSLSSSAVSTTKLIREPLPTSSNNITDTTTQTSPNTADIEITIGSNVANSDSVNILGYELSGMEKYQTSEVYFTYDHSSTNEDSFITSALESNLDNYVYFDYKSQLGGILSNIGSFLDSGLSSLEQTSSKTLFSNTAEGFEPSSNIERTIENTNRESGYETELTLTTKDGDTLTFNLALDYTSGSLAEQQGSFSSKNIHISMSLDGDLSDEEKEAIAAFAKQLDGQINNIMSGGIADFSKLDIFENDTIASVSVSSKAGLSEAYSLEITNTEEARNISYDSKYLDLDIELDPFGLPTNTTDQNEALLGLLKTIEEGNDKAGDYRSHASALKKAVQSIFSNLPESNNFAPVAGGLLSGLPDFTIDYSSKGPGENNRPTEYVGMEISQNTVIDDNSNSYEITQSYRYQLDYDNNNPLAYGTSRQDGEYVSRTGHEEQTRVSHYEQKDGIVIDASIEKSATESSTERYIRYGSVVDSQTTTDNKSSVEDITEQAQQALAENEMLVVEDLMEHLQ